ncbi:cell shape-determining protein MreC [Spirochaetia bacterium]|nr:cell shape-determining protein MreC [Spirochaetia bacterium]GHV21764.1 cell shape-determining protein MreC [Spirochaetia bacterium]
MRRDRKQKKLKNFDAYVFIALSLISFSLLLFSTRSFILEIKDTGLSVFSGVRGGVHAISSFFSGTILSIQELASLRREYMELQDRIARYEQLERTAVEIRQENHRLREQLGFSQNITFKHIPAEISGRDPDNLFSAFVINKGKVHGIANDMPVIAYQNGMQALAGKVINTAPLESLVMPLYDGRSFVASRLAQSRYEGIVEGQGNRNSPLLMRGVNKRARDEVTSGDIIVTSGLGGVYPANVVIGRVTNVLFQEFETSFELEVECIIDFSRLEYVFVIDVTEMNND